MSYINPNISVVFRFLLLFISNLSVTSNFFNSSTCDSSNFILASCLSIISSLLNSLDRGRLLAHFRLSSKPIIPSFLYKAFHLSADCSILFKPIILISNPFSENISLGSFPAIYSSIKSLLNSFVYVIERSLTLKIFIFFSRFIMSSFANKILLILILHCYFYYIKNTYRLNTFFHVSSL
ncbi:hypothetical protein D3C81_1164500 [compost metagenome]